MDITVPTKPLRQALAAVVVHADRNAEHSARHRVRLYVGHELMVGATQGYTVGLATVPIADNGSGEVGHLDLDPQEVRDLLTLFKVSKDTEHEDVVRIRVHEETFTCQDVSGLFAGKSVELPRATTEDMYPNIPAVLGGFVRGATTKSARWDGPGVTAGPWLAAFAAAARTYGEPVLLSPQGGDRPRLLVTIGEHFAGLLTTSSSGEKVEAEIARRDDWATYLPEADSHEGQEL